jgi:hypothetical protein
MILFRFLYYFPRTIYTSEAVNEPFQAPVGQKFFKIRVSFLRQSDIKMRHFPWND